MKQLQIIIKYIVNKDIPNIEIATIINIKPIKKFKIRITDPICISRS